MSPNFDLDTDTPAKNDRTSNPIPIDWYNEHGKTFPHDPESVPLANLEWTLGCLASSPTILEAQIEMPRYRNPNSYAVCHVPVVDGGRPSPP